jgi:hypothetical protein
MDLDVKDCTDASKQGQETALVNAVLNTICNGPTNALVCNKTLIQISHIKTLKITPTCFDHQLIIVRELFDPT